MAVTSHADQFVNGLCDFLQPYSGLIDISLYPGEHQELLSAQIGKIDSMQDYHSLLRCASRDYEFVILHDILHIHTNPLKFLQQIYHSMENSAQIIIVQKQGAMETGELEVLLEKMEFRSPNTIGDLLEGYDVIVAKKMHMWGNGL